MASIYDLRFTIHDLRMGRLVKLLVVKSTIDLVFVAALAVNFYLATFNSHLRGSLDKANGELVAGWAVDEALPEKRVEVQLYVDGSFVANQVANIPRPDVRESDRGKDERCGFVFPMPHLGKGEHEARIYGTDQLASGARKAMVIIGNPKRFTVADAQGGF